MGKGIYVTFKENKEEEDLYNWICKHSTKSGFIKDTMFEKKAEEEANKKPKTIKFYTMESE